MCTSYIYLILNNKTHVPKLFDPILKNDAFAGSTPMKAAYVVFRNSSKCNFQPEITDFVLSRQKLLCYLIKKHL